MVRRRRQEGTISGPPGPARTAAQAREGDVGGVVEH